MDRAQGPMCRKSDEFVSVGRVLRPHGVRGEVVVECWAESPEVFDLDASFFLLPPGGRGRPRPVLVLAWREHGRGLLLRLAEVVDRDHAAELRDCELAVHAGDLPELKEGEVYFHDLLGLDVVLPDGSLVGVLVRFMETPGQEVWVIEHPGGQEVLFPAAEELVKSIDLDAGRVVIAPPPGLLDIYLTSAGDQTPSPPRRRSKAGPRSRAGRARSGAEQAHETGPRLGRGQGSRDAQG